MGVDLGGGFVGSSSLLSSSGPEHRRPVTAQERQSEREEKRRKRQERAMERKRKLKEKEKKEGKQGESLGGVLLSDNDKKLLERWGRMMDGRGDKSQAVDNIPAKTNWFNEEEQTKSTNPTFKNCYCKLSIVTFIQYFKHFYLNRC